MVFSYSGFSVEITKEDWQYLANLGLDTIKKITKPIKESIPKTYTIGLRISTTGLVYQRGKIKVSAKKLSEALSELEQHIASSNLLRFRRPFLEEIFDKKSIKDATSEKAWDEPEDATCSIYIDI
jgi:hypothetical protein